MAVQLKLDPTQLVEKEKKSLLYKEREKDLISVCCAPSQKGKKRRLYSTSIMNHSRRKDRIAPLLLIRWERGRDIWRQKRDLTTQKRFDWVIEETAFLLPVSTLFLQRDKEVHGPAHLFLFEACTSHRNPDKMNASFELTASPVHTHKRALSLSLY